MIKAFSLIFRPSTTWEGIVLARRGVAFILFAYLAPLLALIAAGEAAGLIFWGKWIGAIQHLHKYAAGEIVFLELGLTLLTIGLVFVTAFLLRSFGATFHKRHTFAQSFTVVAYGLGPLFLLRLLNAFSFISPWVAWGIGLFLTWGALYYGVPKALDPDPPQAFGLFILTSLLTVMATGLLAFITAFYLQGRFPRLEAMLSHLSACLPF